MQLNWTALRTQPTQQQPTLAPPSVSPIRPWPHVSASRLGLRNPVRTAAAPDWHQPQLDRSGLRLKHTSAAIGSVVIRASSPPGRLITKICTYEAHRLALGAAPSSRDRTPCHERLSGTLRSDRTPLMAPGAKRALGSAQERLSYTSFALQLGHHSPTSIIGPSRCSARSGTGFSLDLRAEKH